MASLLPTFAHKLLLKFKCKEPFLVSTYFGSSITLLISISYTLQAFMWAHSSGGLLFS